jgi:hypothetical protein
MPAGHGDEPQNDGSQEDDEEESDERIAWPERSDERDSETASRARWAGPPRSVGPGAGFRYSPFAVRACAFILDLVLLDWVAGAASGLFSIGLILWDLPDGFAASPDGYWLVQFVQLVLTLLGRVVPTAALAIWAWVILQATPGQYVLGLRTLEARRGEPIRPRAALTRYVLLFLPALVVVHASTLLLPLSFGYAGSDRSTILWLATLMPFAGVAWYLYLAASALRDPRGRGVHDRAAGSAVVELEERSPSNPKARPPSGS